jgi:hypothetical protein
MSSIKHRAPTGAPNRLMAGSYKHLVPPGPPEAFLSNTVLPHYYPSLCAFSPFREYNPKLTWRF